MSFEFNQLSDPLYLAVNELGYENPTEIQNRAIPLLLEAKRDFIGQAQTGTGKTAAFCLPLLEQIDTEDRSIQAVVLSPTRELANQIDAEIKKLAKFLKINTATVYGGVGYRDQLDKIRKAHIVIATPGRAIDLLEKRKLPIDSVQTLVIDEADEMLKMGFIEDVELIMDSVSDQAKRWMFSATMPKGVVRIIEEKLHRPEIVKVTKKTLSNENVSQSYITLMRRDYFKALKAIVLSEPDFFGIVFCETKEETKNLHEKLQITGKKIVALHGDLSQKDRDAAMNQFRNRKADILVCTDVAARGLDISEVTHVINLGLPRKLDSYVHRVGRTGRAGHVGKAISFVAPQDRRKLRDLERILNQKLKNYDLPTGKESKRAIVEQEIAKMIGLKSAVVGRGGEFKIDDSFEVYRDSLDDMSKEDVLKLLFAYQFNGEFRLIDESLEGIRLNFSSPERPRHDRSRRGRSGGRGRNFNRNSGERSSHRDDDRRSRRRRSSGPGKYARS